MKATFLKYFDRLRSSFWFLPSLMALGALGFAFFTVWLDETVTSEWLLSIDWIYGGGAEGGRRAQQRAKVAGVGEVVGVHDRPGETAQPVQRRRFRLRKDRDHVGRLIERADPRRHLFCDGGDQLMEVEIPDGPGAVSYTHLTLPTIYSV